MKRQTLKIRIVSVLLVILTCFSAISAGIISGAAAEVDAAPSASSAVSADSIIKEIAKDGFKKIAEKITEGNFFTEILGDTSVSIFDSLIDGEQESVASAVSEISQKMDAYHKEEVGILNNLSKKIDEMYDDIRTSSFRSDYDNMRNDSMREINALTWLDQQGGGKDIELTADNIPLIDADTYHSYKTILDDSAINSSLISRDLNAMYLDISGNSQQLKCQNPYSLLIDADTHICNATDFSYDQTVFNAANINGSRDTIDGIHADVLIHYAAYINLMKIECLAKIYQDPDNAQKTLDYYMQEDTGNGSCGVIPMLYRQLEEIEKGYNAANTYYNSAAQASVTYHDASDNTDNTAFYPSAPKAWAYAVSTGRQNLSDVTVTLNADWDVNADTGHLTNMCQWHCEKSPVSQQITYRLDSRNISFYTAPFDGYGYVPAYYCDHSDVGSVTLDLNGHALTSGNISGMCKAGVTTDRNTYSHTFMTDSQGTGTVNGYTLSDYSSFIPLFQYTIWEDSRLTWNLI